MEERLYDIIDDTDMLENHHVQQMQMSLDDLAVNNRSNSIRSHENKCVANLGTPCQCFSSADTEQHDMKEDCGSLQSVDNTSYFAKDN